MEEPGLLIRWTVFFFGGGIAALVGALCIAFVVILNFDQAGKHRVRHYLTRGPCLLSGWFSNRDADR